jgi:hypothetical protein
LKLPSFSRVLLAACSKNSCSFQICGASFSTPDIVIIKMFRHKCGMSQSKHKHHLSKCLGVLSTYGVQFQIDVNAPTLRACKQSKSESLQIRKASPMPHLRQAQEKVPFTAHAVEHTMHVQQSGPAYSFIARCEPDV